MEAQTAEQRQPFTWAELKEYANSLSEDQLKEEVICWGDDRGIKMTGIWSLEEDYISDGESYSPISAFDEETLKEIRDMDEGTLPKGTPRLMCDF